MGLLCSSPLCKTCPSCPCCGYSTQTFVQQEIKEVLKNWVHRLTEVAPQTKLRDMKIMASHDCGTYSISAHKLGSSLSRTQSINVYEQLDLGIRQIDFRYGPSGKKPQDLAVRHGPHSGGNYFQELVRVKQWLEDNPLEFLIIDAKCEKKVSPEQRQYLVQFLTDKFSKYLINKKDTQTWFRIEDVTLGDLRKYNPKRVLLLVDNMILEEDKEGTLAQTGFLNRDDFLVSDWHNTGNVQKLFTKINTYLDAVDPFKEKFMNLQVILTPKVHLSALTNYCLCQDRIRVDQKHFLLFKDKRVQYFIRDLVRTHPVNFVMMDFVNYDPFISSFLVGLNFPYTLKIFEGFVIQGKKRIEVTHRLQELVTSGNSLWLVDFARDLAIKAKRSELHIVYQYQEGDKVEKKIQLKKGEQYLLNCISHLDVTLDEQTREIDLLAEFKLRKSHIFRESEEQDVLQTMPNSERQSSPETASTMSNMCSPLLPSTMLCSQLAA